MEPSRVTPEEAQELFQICMPGIKKKKKPAKTVWDRFWQSRYMRQVTQPPFPRSAMDGFALRSRDVCGADLEHPVTLEVAGCVYAGQKDRAYTGTTSGSPDHDRSNDTGGADCVVKQEDTDYVRIADPDRTGKQSKFIIMWDREKITARKGEDFFCRGNCWQKPDFWWILICWLQLRLREYRTLLYIEDLEVQ